MRMREAGRGRLAVARLDAGEARARALAAAAAAEALERPEASHDAAAGSDDEIFVVSRAAGEISFVLEEAALEEAAGRPALREAIGAARVERGWRAIRLEGPFEFTLTGILSQLLDVLAKGGVGIYAFSTYDTDCILVKEGNFAVAVELLRAAGHEVTLTQPDALGESAAGADQAAADEGRVGGLRPFALERYFARYEFSAPYLLCCSDCESLGMRELLAMSSPKTLELWDSLKLGYTESRGNPALLEAIRKQYEADPASSRAPEDEELVVLVPEEGIYLGARAILRAGDHVIVPQPCYQSLAEVALAIGCTVSWWKPKAGADGSWTFDVEDLAALTTERTRLVVTNFPHNPTSAMLPHADWERVVSICREAGAYLFSDEMYRGLELQDGVRLQPAFAAYEKAISLCGVSKTLSVPGLRIGWLASQDKELIKSILTLKDYTTICPSAPSELLAIVALENSDQIIQRNVEIINRGLDAMEQFAAAHPGVFAAYRPLAGTTCFLKYLGGDAMAFSQRVVNDAGIMLLPSAVYNLDEDPQCVRVGFGRENVPGIFEKLAQAL